MIGTIADQLHLSTDTVQNHVARIREHFHEAGPFSSQPLLTTAQAAAACGKSVRTWRTWDAAGYIPMPVKIGRSTLWRATELLDWVASGCPHRREWEFASRERLSLNCEKQLADWCVCAT